MKRQRKETFKILLIEGDSNIRKKIKNKIKFSGYIINDAETGKEAFDILSKSSYDLLILDNNLSDINPKNIIKKHFNIPFIVITKHGEIKSAVEMMKLGAIDYLIKDVEFIELIPQIIEKVMDDIEKEKRLIAAENSLNEIKEELLNIFEHSYDIIYKLNLEKFTFDYVSPSIKKVLGIPPEEIINININKAFTYLHSDDVKTIKDNYKNFTTDGIQKINSLFTEYRVKGRNSKYHWLNDTRSIVLNEKKEPVAVIGNIRDVTAQKKVEEELKKSKERFKQISETITDYIYTVNLKDSVPYETIHTESCIYVTGYTSEEFKKNQFLWYEMIHVEDRKNVNEQVATVLSGKQPETLEHRIYKKDGSIKWIRSSMALHFDANNVLTSYDGLVQDITERKVAEKKQDLLVEILKVLNQPGKKVDTIHDILMLIKNFTDFEAVGIRLKEWDDYPYYETIGFSDEFVKSERYLCKYDENGELIKNTGGQPALDCICGKILNGETDKTLQFYTKNGSFWINEKKSFLKYFKPDDKIFRQGAFESRCFNDGYESIALIPLHSGKNVIGLLQLNDKRKNLFTPELISFFEGIGESIGIALERKHNMQALRENEEQFRRIFEDSPIGKVLFDHNGNLININKTSLKILGIKNIAEIKNTNLLKDKILSQKILRKILKNKIVRYEAKIDFELAAQRNFYKPVKKGIRFLYIVISPIIQYPNRIPGAYLVHIQDITEQKNAENSLRESQDKLLKLNEDLENKNQKRTEQLENINKELESFAYSVSHDLRAPLRHINGFSELLKKENLNTESGNAEKYLNIIIDSSKRMGNLIDDLLSFSRTSRTAINYTRINLLRIIEDAKNLFSDDITSRKIEFKILVLPLVKGDAPLLRQVVINLISNAIKYTKNSIHPVIEIGAINKENETTIYVRDNGVGFNMQYKDKLFGVFQRLHDQEEFEGNGIGLALVKRIIERHNGKVWAEGEVGKGATFYFSLQSI